MPKVFVHGNPECSAVWISSSRNSPIGRSTMLSGFHLRFGAPVPDGFEATMAGYHAWLVAELEAIDGPIDLVGHDWGTGHVAGIAADRPDLIRSFAMDCGGLVHPDYVWHDMAQAWQTPEVGEQVVAAMTERRELTGWRCSRASACRARSPRSTPMLSTRRWVHACSRSTAAPFRLRFRTRGSPPGRSSATRSVRDRRAGPLRACRPGGVDRRRPRGTVVRFADQGHCG